MKTRILALFAGLLAVLPMTSAWATGGGSTTTYYAQLTAKLASNNTGRGTVYAAASSTATSGKTTYQNTSTTSSTFDFYAFATPSDPSAYVFTGWSKTDNLSDEQAAALGNATSPMKVTVSNASTSSSTYTEGGPWFAYFVKKQLEAFGITFETSAGGAYTVDGAAPASKTGLTEATTVKLASSDPNFLNWRVNGSIVNVNPYDLTCTAATTVSAEFLTADQVAEATTFAELTAALA